MGLVGAEPIKLCMTWASTCCVEFGDGCDEGCGVFTVYGFLTTRMCARGTHEVCDCRLVGGGVGSDKRRQDKIRQDEMR